MDAAFLSIRILFGDLCKPSRFYWPSFHKLRLASGVSGFTLTELMLSVAIIGILAAIVLPKLSNQIRRSQEAVTKMNLGVLRSALSIYYSDTEGQYPRANITTTMGGKYWNSVPTRYVPPWHPAGNDIDEGSWADMTEAHAAWFYVDDQTSPNWGQIVVNCVHTDLKGITWSTY